MIGEYGFRNTLNLFAGSGYIYIFTIIAIIILIVELDRKYKKFIIMTISLLVISIFNPISYKVLINITGKSAEYYRFLWIVPYGVLLTYLSSKVIYKKMVGEVKLFPVVLFSVLMVVLNVDKNDLIISENVYQIDSVTLEVAQYLEKQIELGNVESLTILCDTTICKEIREYNAKICFPFEGYYYSSYEQEIETNDICKLLYLIMNNEKDMDKEGAKAVIQETGIRYIVVNSSYRGVLEYLNSIGWEIEKSVDGYEILAPVKVVYDESALEL